MLIGHSDGASISLINAGGTPSTGLRGVVTMAPHVFCEEVSVSAIRKARDAFVGRDLRKRLTKYHHKNTDCAFWGWCDDWLDADFMHWNIEEYLPSITAPQLVIQGKEDPYSTVVQVDSIVSQSGGPVDVCMLERCEPGFPIWLWYFCPFDQSSSLEFRGFLERHQATEGDTQWVNYKRSPFSSRSTDF